MDFDLASIQRNSSLDDRRWLLILMVLAAQFLLVNAKFERLKPTFVNLIGDEQVGVNSSAFIDATLDTHGRHRLPDSRLADR